MAAATLEVRIGGLCLLVPDPNGKGDATGNGTATDKAQLQVVLPTTHGGGHTHDAHEAVLLYDLVYKPGNSGTQPNQSWHRENLAGAVWSFGAQGGSGIDLGLPPEVTDAGALHGATLDPALVLGTPVKGKTVARVVLEGGACGDWGDGVAWETDPADPDGEEQTGLVYWDIADAVPVDKKLVVYKDGVPAFELVPYDGRIVIELHHVPASELPPQFGAPPPHYHFYPALLGVNDGKHPKYRGDPDRGINPVMCLVAKAELK